MKELLIGMFVHPGTLSQLIISIVMLLLVLTMMTVSGHL